MRLLCALLSVNAVYAVRPHNGMERSRAQLCFQTAAGLWALSGPALFWAHAHAHDRHSENALLDEELQDLLALVSGETLIRRAAG